MNDANYRELISLLERIADALERIAAKLTAEEGSHGSGARLKGLPDLRAPKASDGE
jgi:hypothetical protein